MPDAKPVIWAPAAEGDLRDIWNYLVREASQDTADEQLREIAKAAEELGRRPMPGRARTEVAPDLRSVLCHPHIIFFRLRDGTVEIVRVLHESRDFPSIFRVRR